MTTRNSTLVGVFNERAQAENVIEQLHNAGIPDDQIRYSGSGATGGGFLAGIKSLFTGEDAAGDGLANDLAGMGLSQDEANYYRNEHQAGHYVVAVNPGSSFQQAQTILNSAGAYNYNSRSAGTTGAYTQTADTGYTTQTTGTGYGTNTTGTAYDSTRSADYADTDEGRRMKLREERLNVDKQTVQTGEARLRKDVVEEQQSIDVPVNREEVVLERNTYGQDRPTDAPIGQDETIRVPVREEQVSAGKETIETGEVSIGKRTVQGQQRVSDTVRREEAHLETDGNANVRNTNTDTTTNRDNY